MKPNLLPGRRNSAMLSIKIKIFFFTTILVLAWSDSIACGVCRFHDLGRFRNKSYISILHRFDVYESYSITSPVQQTSYFVPGNARIAHVPDPGSITDKIGKDRKTFKTLELRGNLNIAETFNLTFILPYEVNSIYYARVLNLAGTSAVTDSLLEYTGISSAIGIVEYYYEKEHKSQKHILRPAFGMNFSRRPVVDPSQVSAETDFTIQPGAGIPEFFFRFTYQYLSGSSGGNFSIIRGWSRENDPGYWFGKSMNARVSYSYKFGKNTFSIYPEAGMGLDHTKPDIEFSQNADNTGGTIMLAHLGLHVNWKKMSIGTGFQKPFYQRLSGDQIQFKSRVMTQLSLYF